MKSTADIIRSAWQQGLAVPAFNVPYLPMVEPVVRATRDQDSFALVTVVRLEWIKFEAHGLDHASGIPCEGELGAVLGHEAVYTRTTELIRDYFGLSGLRRLVGE